MLNRVCTCACVSCVCVVHACVHVAVEQCPELASQWIMPVWVDVCGKEVALVVISSETYTLTKTVLSLLFYTQNDITALRNDVQFVGDG